VGLNQIEEIEITYVMSTSSVPEFVIVCNSRVGDIFKINDLLAAFVVFTVTTKVVVKRFYRSPSSIFFTSSSD
jgi:hypothetical protein